MFEFMCVCMHMCKGQPQDRQSLIGLELTHSSRLSQYSPPWSASVCLNHLILSLRQVWKSDRFSSSPDKLITNSLPSSEIDFCAWCELTVEIYPSSDCLLKPAECTWVHLPWTHVSHWIVCLGATVSATVIVSWAQWSHLIFWA